MMNKMLTKKCITLLLSLTLIFTLVPVAVFAEGQSQPWAIDAVDALNNIYGNSTFTADNTYVTVNAAKNLLINTFKYPADGEIIVNYLADGTNLTRLQLAQIVYTLYGLTSEVPAVQFEDCDDIAVLTLRSLGIVSGKSDGTFAPEDTVTNAELAVIFYRTLGKIGASGNTALESIRPGEYGYDELMYLYTRACVPRDVNPLEDIESMTVRHYYEGFNYDEYSGKEEIWNFWCTRLAGLPSDGRTVTWSVYEDVYGPDPEVPYVSLLDAAVKIVDEDRSSLISDGMEDKTGIFSDVNPGDWFYDGVMYLFNNGIVSGYGNGTFGPLNQLSRAELAILMCRINGIDTNSPAAGVDISDNVPGWAYNAVTHAIDKGYMKYADGTNFNAARQVIRQEAALAIFSTYGGYDAGDVSLSVLERFTDSADIGEAYKASMAYLVSAGVVRGTADGNIAPEDIINRASLGVLLARVMMGLDKSKMHDYETALTEVLQ